MMHIIGEELRSGMRGLAATPKASLLALLTLALAGGGVATLVSLLSAIVLRPLDVPAPERLAIVTVADARGVQAFMSLDAISHLEGMTDVFAAVCGTTGITASRILVNNQTISVSRESVTAGCQQTIASATVLGRPLSPREAASGEPVAVISHRLWRDVFQADPGIIGRTLPVEAIPLTIIGVAARDGTTTSRDQTPDLILPLRLMSRLLKTPIVLRASYVVGRLQPGVTREATQARLTVEWPRVLEAAGKDPVANRYMHAAVSVNVEDGAGGISRLRRRYARPLVLLTGLGAMLLLVACINVGGILLARLRARETALLTHLALGATHARIVARMTIECLLVSMGAALLSVVMAFWLSRALASMLWTGAIPLTIGVTPDARVLLGSLVGGLLSGLIVAAPAVAWWMKRSRGTDSLLSPQARTVLQGGSRVGKGLIVVQMALAFGLLCGAAVFMQELMALQRVDPGYETRDLYFTRPAPVPGPAPQIDSEAYIRALMARLSALEGVRGVALSSEFPVATVDRTPTVPVRFIDARAEADASAAIVDIVSPSFFPTIGVDLMKGRLFTEQDDMAHPSVAIVNARLARELFGQADPLGKRIRIGQEPAGPPVEIVGVVETIRPGDLRMPDTAMAYRPIWQEPAVLRNPMVTLRAQARESLASDVRQTVGSFGYNYVNSFSSVRAQLDENMVTERALSALSWCAGALATLVAALGLYALLAFTVTQRTREMGLRLALGASGRELRRLLAREGLTLVATGLVLGVPIALGLFGVIATLMPTTSRPAAGALVAAGVVLLLAGICAVAGPAWRAGRTDPAVALRAE